MNDTITLSLNNLKKHEQIVNSLRLMQNGFRKFESERGNTLMAEVIFYDITKREKEKFLYRVREQASSHYKVIFICDKFRDNITFSFSIPKYIYGQNIVQSIMNSHEIHFSLMNHSFEHHVEEGFDRLMQFISLFFKNEFPACKMDIKSLELKRLDFCWNQIFRSKTDALLYLEHQKDVKPKNLREYSTKSVPYNSSIFFSNKDYSIKIYHKGSEYEQKDRKEHEYLNRAKDREVFDIEYLQGFADKILRYETTIRPSYMSYLFNQYIFRKNSAQFQTWKRVYNKIKSAKKSLEDAKWFETDKKNLLYSEIINYCQDKIDKNTGLKFFEYMFFHKYKFINKHPIKHDRKIYFLEQFYLDFDVLIHYRRRFYFRLHPGERAMHYEDMKSNDNKFETFKYVIFTKDLYKLMAKKLHEFIFDMRIEQKKPLVTYLSKIEDYNKQVQFYRDKTKHIPSYAKQKGDAKIDRCKLGLLLAAMDGYTFDEICRRLQLSRQTKNNYKTQLKKIGWSKNALNLVDLVVPDIDYKDYYIESQLHEYKLFGDRRFTRLPDSTWT